MRNNSVLTHVEMSHKFDLSKLTILFLISVLALRLASGATANASFLLIALYALLGRAQAIQAMFLSWLFTMINPALAPDASFSSIGRYLVIFLAAISVLFRSINADGVFHVKRVNLYTLLVGIFLLFHSILFSAMRDVSVLKAVSWMVVVLTLLSAWQGLPSCHRLVLFRQVQNFLILLIMVSMPLLGIPNIGYRVNGAGYQGFLNHPQAFGLTVALVGVLVGGRILRESRPAWRDILLLGLCLVLVVLSEARTAGLAMILGLFGSALLSPVFAGIPRRKMMPGLRSKRFQALVLISFACALVFGPFLADRLSVYFKKRTDSASFLEAAEASRGALVEKMILNIKEKPLAGIGFGIGSYPDEMEIERDAVFNLPIGAPIEKGVMPVAIIEEIGVIGAAIVFLWFIYVFRIGAKVSVSQFAVLITLILVNFGESMFFSVGGMGMLLLIIFAGAVSGDKQTSGRIQNA